MNIQGIFKEYSENVDSDIDVLNNPDFYYIKIMKKIFLLL